jgi:hypothetical protein
MRCLRAAVFAAALILGLTGCGQTREVECHRNVLGNPTCTETTTTPVQRWWNDLSDQMKGTIVLGGLWALVAGGNEIAKRRDTGSPDDETASVDEPA